MTPGTPRSWETLERTLAHSCSAFDVYTETVRLPDGATARFDYVSEPPSAVVLAFTADDGVVLTREYRHAVGRVAIGLPGGSREPADDSMAETARRELREEAGYTVDGEVVPLLAAEPANGLLDSTRHYFLATGCRPGDGPDRDPDETIEVETVRYGRLLDEIEAGDVRDERTVTAVLLYEFLGSRGATPGAP